MSITERLHEMRNYGGKALTKGLPDDVILGFAARDPRLGDAERLAKALARDAHGAFEALPRERRMYLAQRDVRRREHHP